MSFTSPERNATRTYLLTFGVPFAPTNLHVVRMRPPPPRMCLVAIVRPPNRARSCKAGRVISAADLDLKI